MDKSQRWKAEEDCVEWRRRLLQKQQSQRTSRREETQKGRPRSGKNVAHPGAHGRHEGHDNSETVGVLNPVWEREEADSAGAGGQWKTEKGVDGQVSEVESIRGLREVEAPTATETAITEEVMEGGDPERPARFWEEGGPSRYGLQPERDTRRQDL
ncbi:hypothetical protein NDU88_004259 [Pleurodeles waltl]|uniref:Uncharacterized protein n=1 Tax=Pleurodeles waltl TaxID=8319 RepID=A0AAV7PEI3_PLEWA|nr:hypothetical protein NDU88_004259 [Pleurodeles waltl]